MSDHPNNPLGNIRVELETVDDDQQHLRVRTIINGKTEEHIDPSVEDLDEVLP